MARRIMHIMANSSAENKQKLNILHDYWGQVSKSSQV